MIKTMTSLAFICLISTAAFSQKSAQLAWITGVWKINTGKGMVIEQWQVLNDSTLQGRSMFVKNGTDTLPQESIELVYKNGDWFYIPTVASQNNALPVSFKIILLKGAEFISENPTHDFPQRIAYRRINNQLLASIEGRKNGKYGKQNFDFTSQ